MLVRQRALESSPAGIGMRVPGTSSYRLTSGSSTEPPKLGLRSSTLLGVTMGFMDELGLCRIGRSTRTPGALGWTHHGWLWRTPTFAHWVCTIWNFVACRIWQHDYFLGSCINCCKKKPF